MANYINSEATKKALIMAAGELFTEYGFDAVTTRMIAEKAGGNTGNIHYHFGGKDGLIEAVITFAIAPWLDNPLGQFLDEHRYLLRSRNGQNMLIIKLIDLYWETHFKAKQPNWCCTLIFRLSQSDLPLSRRTFDASIAPVFRAFIEVYQAASGDMDIEHGYNWSLSILAPALLTNVDPFAASRVVAPNRVSDKFVDKLKKFCTQNALASLQFVIRLKENVKIKTEII